MWEGGHRVPAIAYWRSKALPQEIDQPILSMDIFPTVVDLVGTHPTSIFQNSTGKVFWDCWKVKRQYLKTGIYFGDLVLIRKPSDQIAGNILCIKKMSTCYNLAEDLEENLT